MLDALYIATSGMTGFSQNLTVIGNNVANLNTPGFKTSQTLFTDLFYRSQFGDANTGGQPQTLDLGAGLGIAGTRRNFTQGEQRSSGNDLDVAIDGQGFLVLRRDGQTFYSRAGQLAFDAQGWLVAADGQSRVAGYGAGALHDINITAARTNPGKPTSRVLLTGTLNSNALSTEPFTVSNVTVFDGFGQAQVLSLAFSNEATRAVDPLLGGWEVKVSDAKGNALLTGELRFGGDGNPLAGFNQLTVPLGAEGSGAGSTELFFGEPGSSTGARSLSAASSDLQAASQDGHAAGALLKAAFDTHGQLVVNYSNGQSIKLDTLALAGFNNLQALRPQAGGQFSAGADEAPVLGTAGRGGFGAVAPGKVELANVDLAQEFSDLIISQRGYQASSQVLSTVNELVQQLFDLKARR